MPLSLIPVLVTVLLVLSALPSYELSAEFRHVDRRPKHAEEGPAAEVFPGAREGPRSSLSVPRPQPLLFIYPPLRGAKSSLGPAVTPVPFWQGAPGSLGLSIWRVCKINGGAERSWRKVIKREKEGFTPRSDTPLAPAPSTS